MKTPKEFTKNLNNGIISDEMFSLALYSVNKRAKNYRDKYRQYDIANYIHAEANAAKAEKSMEEMYKRKEILLSLLKPVCIHKELIGFERTRTFSKQSGYYQKMLYHSFYENIVWTNSYVDTDYGCYYDYDCDYDNVICFFDYVDKNQPIYNFYLFYILGDHSYHIPIDNIEKYSNLDVVSIGKITTQGHTIDNLISVQFVDKMISLIKSGKYKYDHDSTFDTYTIEEEFYDEADSWLNYEMFEEAWEHVIKRNKKHTSYILSDKEKETVRKRICDIITYSKKKKSKLKDIDVIRKLYIKQYKPDVDIFRYTEKMKPYLDKLFKEKYDQFSYKDIGKICISLANQGDVTLYEKYRAELNYMAEKWQEWRKTLIP